MFYLKNGRSNCEKNRSHLQGRCLSCVYWCNSFRFNLSGNSQLGTCKNKNLVVVPKITDTEMVTVVIWEDTPDGGLGAVAISDLDASILVAEDFGCIHWEK